MEIESVFVDTSWFKAVIDDRDEFHLKAVEQLDMLIEKKSLLVTSNFITDETFTLVRKRGGIDMAKKLYDLIAEFGDGLKIVRVMIGDEKTAWNWFWKDWSKLSYTDCTSFVVMERLGIKKVATFDGHFRQAGFEIV